MTIKRRIQITAMAVIVNGAIALGLASPTQASEYCGGINVCDIYGACPVNHQLRCKGFAPAGCKVLTSFCTLAPSCMSGYKVVCSFVTI